MKRQASCYALLLTAALLGGCMGGSVPRPSVAIYDLGTPQTIVSPGLAIGKVEVGGPSWLETTAMQYRLSAEPARRQAFAESRWAAPPTELLETSLKRALTGGNETGCRLKVELDELVQQFDEGGLSRSQLSLRAALISARAEELIGRKSLHLEQAAGGDARSGVLAFVQIRNQLAEELARWTNTPELLALKGRCKS